MRFDIVLNNVAGFARTEHRAAVTSDGTPWRPLVHAFKTQWDVAAGAAQVHRVFGSIAIGSETFHGRGHTRIKQIEHLLKTGQVDGRWFWTGV